MKKKTKKSLPFIVFDDIGMAKSDDDEELLWNETVRREMIFMDEFEMDQLLGSELQIKCKSSNYFSSDSFQLALEFQNQTELHLLPGVKIIRNRNQI